MDCTRASDLMMDYFDKALNKEDREDLFLHLKTCITCGEEFHALEAALEDVFMLEDFLAPDNFELEIMSQININEYAHQKEKFKYKGFIAIAALFVTAFICGLVYLRFGTVEIKEVYSYANSITRLFSVPRVISSTSKMVSTVALLWVQFIKEMPVYIKSIVGAYFAVLSLLGAFFIAIQLVLMKLTSGEILEGGNLYEDQF